MARHRRWRPPWRERRVLATLAVVVLIVAVAGFSLLASRAPTTTAGTGPGLAGATTSTSTSPGGPRIIDFAIPRQVTCGGAASIPVSWSTTGALGVTIAIDGSVPYTYGPASGSATVPFPCDGAPHTYLLVATAAGGISSSLAATVVQG